MLSPDTKIGFPSECFVTSLDEDIKTCDSTIILLLSNTPDNQSKIDTLRNHSMCIDLMSETDPPFFFIVASSAAQMHFLIDFIARFEIPWASCMQPLSCEETQYFHILISETRPTET